MRDKVAIRKANLQKKVDLDEKSSEKILLSKLKQSKTKKIPNDITADILAATLFKRLNLNNIYQRDETINNEKPSLFSRIVGIFFLISIVGSIIITIMGAKGMGMNKASGGADQPFKVYKSPSKDFKNLICYGKKNLIDSVVLSLVRINDLIDNTSKDKLAGKISPSKKNYLLYGKPGTGKTLFVMKLCYFFDLELKLKSEGKKYNSFNELYGSIKEKDKLDKIPSKVILLTAEPSDFVSKFVGDTEKNIAKLFDSARDFVKKGFNVVIFIDEIDTFFKERTKSTQEHSINLKAQFLTLLDGATTKISDKIFFFGATNLEKDIDKAFIRRLENRYKFDLPNEEERREFILKSLNQEYFIEEADVKKSVKESDGMSFSNLASAFSEIRRNNSGKKESPDFDHILKVFNRYKGGFFSQKKLSVFKIAPLDEEEKSELMYNIYDN